jgi:hypothetical protein
MPQSPSLPGPKWFETARLAHGSLDQMEQPLARALALLDGMKRQIEMLGREDGMESLMASAITIDEQLRLAEAARIPSVRALRALADESV